MDVQMILKFFCQGKLDDHSIAGLLRIPETTTIACHVLRRVWYRLQSQVAFSSTHSETSKTLVALLHNGSANSRQRANTVDALCDVIALENDNIILSLVSIWKCLLLDDTQPAVQIASVYFVSGLVGEVVRLHPGVFELWEILIKTLVDGIDDEVRIVAGRALRRGFNASCHVRSRIASIPNIKRLLSNVIRSEATISAIRLLAWEIQLKIAQTVGDDPNSHDSWIGVGEVLEGIICPNFAPDKEVVRYPTLTYQISISLM
jgi:hypothetical protein